MRLPKTSNVERHPLGETGHCLLGANFSKFRECLKPFMPNLDISESARRIAAPSPPLEIRALNFKNTIKITPIRI
ncbi:hypothetical protein V2J09_005971 [Rumex salicifolius]